MMKLMPKILLGLCLALPLSVAAQHRSPSTQHIASADKPKADISITIVHEKERLSRGDSMLVTYRLRSSLPLNGIRMTQRPTLKGQAGWRELTAYYPRQRQINEGGKTYYQLDAAHFVIAPTAVATLSISEAIFEADVITGQTQSQDPFDFFFGSGVRYTTEKQTIKAPKHSIRAEEAPLRSTQEVLQRGAQLL